MRLPSIDDTARQIGVDLAGFFDFYGAVKVVADTVFIFALPYRQVSTHQQRRDTGSSRMPSTALRSLVSGRPVFVGAGVNGWMMPHCLAVNGTLLMRKM